MPFLMLIPVLLSACLFYLTFPNRFFLFGCWPLGWLALVCIFPVLEKRAWPARLGLGLVFGLVFYGSLVAWFIPYSLLGYIIFVCALAIQPILFFGLYGFKPRWYFLDLLYVPSLWTATEYLRTVLLKGFSWNLGCSQAWQPLSIQTAALWGPFGVSFVLVLFNYSLYKFIFINAHRRFYGCILVLVAGVVFGYGFFVLHNRIPLDSGILPLRLLAVQPNVGVIEKGDDAFFVRVVSRQIVLSHKQAEEFKPDLIVWPETAVPGDFRQEPWVADALRRMATDLDTYVLIGAALQEDGRNYNSLVLFNPRGKITGMYHKRQLVPLSEYLPLGSIWQDFKKLMYIRSYDFNAGTGPGIFAIPMKSRDGKMRDLKFGVAICSEDTWGMLFKEYKQKGVGLIIIAANDGWFRQAEALVLHAQCAVMNAVAHRIPVVRVTNTGWTCHIDHFGRIVDSQAAFYSETSERMLVHPVQRKTLYDLIGDSLCILSLGFVIIQWIGRIKSKP